MDRKAGYKECPRCGLRNKPSALQCDFCGLRFVAGEDWDDNIQALEKMGGNEEKVLVDEDVSKRIEATIVKREKINIPAKPKEPVKDDFDYFAKPVEPVMAIPVPVAEPPVAAPRETILTEKAAVIEPVPETPSPVAAVEPVQALPEPERIVIMEQPPAEPKPEMIAVPEPAPVEVIPEKIVIPERPPVEAMPEPVMDKKVVRRRIRPAKVFAPVKNPSKRRTVFTAVLVLGLVSYLVAIAFGLGTIGRAGGWIMVTVSTLMVVAAAGEFFLPKGDAKAAFPEDPAPEGKTHQEVLICPKCHELVKTTDRACPDCGAEFQGE